MSPYREPGKTPEEEELRWPAGLRSRAALVLFAVVVVVVAALCAAPLLPSAPGLRVEPPQTAQLHQASPPQAPREPPVFHEDEGFQCAEGYRNFTMTGRVEMSCTFIPSVSVLAYAKSHHESVFIYMPGLHQTCTVLLGPDDKIGLECPAQRVVLDGDYAAIVMPPDPFRGVREGVPTVTGALAPDVIRSVVRDDLVRFRACYAEGLRRDPKLAGSISTTFVIDYGAVTSAQNAASSVSDATLVACVTHAFSQSRFPQRVAPTTVVYPLVFAPPARGRASVTEGSRSSASSNTG